MSSTLELNVDELELDLKNPRFAGLTSQREALEKIVVNQGIKLVNLAEDISLNGLSPAHRMLVMKAPGKKSSSYIALDGNRRLAALRVLANPSVLDGMTGVGDITARRLRNLAKTFSLADVQPIDVSVCKDEDEARHWIEAIHTGENDGRGVVGWDGIATARYRGHTSSLKVLDFVRNAGKLSDEEESALERFPITNLDRLLGTPEVRERLGLAFEDGELLSDLPQSELIKPLKRIVSDIALKKITVSGIKSKDDRLEYLKSLGPALPDLSKRTGTLEPLDQLSAQSKTGTSKAGTGSTSKSLVDRKTLIPPNSQCSLNINDHKLQQMCKELRKLPLENYPIAIAASFRVFLELSLDHFGAEKKVPQYNPDISLKQKVERISSYLQDNGLATKRDLQEFRALASNSNKALSIDRLHGIIHSKYSLPTPSELRSGWSEVQVAFTKIWA
ncbi:hypothetical protein QSH18_15755 [Xanthomonas sp. NCPPB 2654]|uniref:hypothetical protein n=1 Tax=unclassified Xanthomonas TaxID=2643310 RepID=UPI0021DFAAF0|nr:MULTISPECIES: hypothetical protein [unclassified Xanthomonas]MDL5367065.1 hypothetical protein [Xanthomonas sp. NCPPB 2654]UYC20627.1 hypothetical protein NUG20_21290 [Xanthomonas sp. CFBP 8443]